MSELWHTSEIFRRVDGAIVEERKGNPFSSIHAKAFIDVRLASDYDALRAQLAEYDSHGPEGRNCTNAQFVELREELFAAQAQLAAVTRERDEARADAEAGRKLWAWMVEANIPWSEPDYQEALTDMGLLVAKDMDAEDSGPECDNCCGDCGTCYRTSETLLVTRTAPSAPDAPPDAPCGVIEDGFGGVWPLCQPACRLQIVRPGKVQCECWEW